jgi:hypothetical protein
MPRFRVKGPVARHGQFIAWGARPEWLPSEIGSSDLRDGWLRSGVRCQVKLGVRDSPGIVESGRGRAFGVGHFAIQKDPGRWMERIPGKPVDSGGDNRPSDQVGDVSAPCAGVPVNPEPMPSNLLIKNACVE